jgi:asparagine synthase (glutamine-hydrolysing)
MLHERFYQFGAYREDCLGLSVGWTCIKGGFNDCLPIWNETRDICLIFNGEHYSDPGEADLLRSKGHDVVAQNASSLVHLYEELGLEFLQRLNGIFSGILIDLRVWKIVLFNDRYGLSRVYYREKPDGFYFASEAKALLKALPEVRGIDPASLGEFFSCGCVLQNRSLFAGLSVLPGGSMWSFSPGQPVKKGFYWRSALWEDRPTLGPEQYYERLKETFARIIPRYFNGDQAVGISLTGGVDSRMVMAWARSANGRLPCYTFSGKYRDSSDVKIARQVAAICGKGHQVIPLDDKFIGEFPSLAEKTVYISDGSMDVSGAADLYLNRVAREIAPVRMTGNYGGEILRRIVAFKPMPLAQELFDKTFWGHIEAARTSYARELHGHGLSFVAFKQVPWHHYSRLSLEQSQIAMRSPYLDNDLIELAYLAPTSATSTNEMSLRLIADGNPALGRIGTDRGLLCRSMPVVTSVQHWYQEFTYRAEYAYDYGMPQWLCAIDHIATPLHLERLFLGRHKFNHFRVWYRDSLGGYLKQVLLDESTLQRPYFERHSLEKAVLAHTRGTGNYTLEIHRALTVELIQRQLIEAQ